MELYVFRHSEYEELYNCSVIDVEVVPLEQRRWPIVSWITIVLCAVYYALYLPCMFSFWKNMHLDKHEQNTCYTLLFYIGVVDMSILWILGFLQGWLSLQGAVFCSKPTLIYFAGLAAQIGKKVFKYAPGGAPVLPDLCHTNHLRAVHHRVPCQSIDNREWGDARLTGAEQHHACPENADAFKPKGSLSFRIDNFREFTKRLPERETSKRHCDAKVSVRGLTFGLTVCPVRFHTFWQGRRTNPVHSGMSIIVKCENASGCDMKGDGSWSCLALVTIRIKTLLGAVDIEEFTHRFFSGKEESSLELTSDRPLHFEHLMDPKNGFYNEKEDTLELVAEIAMDPPDGIMELLKTDAIRVNEEMVAINKNQLALYSRFFHKMFYSGQFREGQSGEYKVKIEAPATVEHFKRMMQTLYPMNKPLDDECIEGVLHLADQFLVTVVKGKCYVFLGRKSTKSALFKYRLADKYGFAVLKEYLLNSLKVTDFEGELFMANLAECVQLGPDAMEALKTRFKALFPSAAKIVG